MAAAEPGDGPASETRAGPPAAPLAILVLIGLCVLVELVLQLAGLVLPRGARLRLVVYDYAAFWPGLLSRWRENYPGQREVMFVSHAFLHGGLLHLGMNMLTLWSLGREVVARVGQARFLLIYAVSAIGGAGLYGWLAPSPQPMVGASGALFGLAGALIAWGARLRAEERLGLRPVLQAVAMLVGINLVMWVALEGQLAWQAHLGGALAGAALALLFHDA